MYIPANIPGLKWLTAVTVLYAFIWIGLEGSLWRVMLLGVSITAVTLGYLLQKRWGGQTVSRRKGLGLTAVSGLLFGLGSGLLTLLFMAVKTGLHAHGPEFTPREILWVTQQIPLWAVAGLFAGLGIGVVIIENGKLRMEN